MKLDSIVRFALIASCASGLFALDTAELAKRSDKGFKPVVVKDWKAPDESTILTTFLVILCVMVKHW